MAIRSPSQTPAFARLAAITAVFVASCAYVTERDESQYETCSGRSFACRSRSFPIGAISSTCSIARLPSDHAESATDADRLSGDPAAGVGGEQRHHRRDIGRVAKTPDRIGLDQLLAVGLDPRLIVRGLDQAEREVIRSPPGTTRFPRAR